MLEKVFFIDEIIDDVLISLNITANNYLKHHEYEAMLKELGKCQGKAACDAVFSKYKLS